MAVLDIDHSGKQVNDFGGHKSGDAVLVQSSPMPAEPSQAGRGASPERFGGDEFAWVMPGKRHPPAGAGGHRAGPGELIAHDDFPRPYRITDLRPASATPTVTVPSGRVDQSRRHRALLEQGPRGAGPGPGLRPPSVTSEIGATGAPTGQRGALAGADGTSGRSHEPSMPKIRRCAGHSDRVAHCWPPSLAHAAGWSPERSMMLREAALVHDVGKVGLPERLLVAGTFSCRPSAIWSPSTLSWR